MNITTIGLDLAKNIFHAVCTNPAGKSIKKKKLKRNQVASYFSQIPPCLVAMEACASAHYWGRKLEALGHTVKLIPPHKVKPYVNGQKNDYNDAAGIAEAATREHIRCVSIKTIEQQDAQSLHRLRSARTKERTALCNQMRGLLLEYGISIPRGVSQLRKQLPELLEDAENGLSLRIRPWLARGYKQLLELDSDLVFYTAELEKLSQQNEDCQRLQTLPGFGPIVANAFACHVGNGSSFKRGRDVSASIGLVPRQHSSGDKTVLSGITKRGNGFLRSLLIHGARSVVRHADKKDDALSRWINRIKATRGANKAAVALANKMARIGWAMIVNKTDFKVVTL